MPRRFLSLLVMLTLLGSAFALPVRTVGAAAAASPGLTAAVRALQAYGILDIRPQTELRLGEPITRAEAAKLVGAALGLQAAAQAAQAQPAFADTAGHWANGWIAAARDRGLLLGRAGGFEPNGYVTYAEMLTILLRAIGRSSDAARDWPWGAVAAAAMLGMIPPELDLQGAWHEPASRGDVIELTAAALGRIPLTDSGLTVLQSLWDREPPVLLLTGFPTATSDRVVAVSGDAGDAVAVEVAGKRAELLPDGSFRSLVTLSKGENPILVAAVDGAGNRSEVQAIMTWRILSSLELSPALVESAVGESFTLTLRRIDTGGHAEESAGANWSYDPSGLAPGDGPGQFRALKPGTYTVRATLNGLEAAGQVIVADIPAQLDIRMDTSTLTAGGRPVPVRLRVLDSAGRLNPAGPFQIQVKTVPQGAATLDKSSVTASAGEAVVYLAPGPAPGSFGLQAKMTGTNEATSPLLPVSVEARRFTAINLAATPANLPVEAGLPVTITATAVDQVGAPIAVSEDITVQLRSSDSTVLRPTRNPVIMAGSSSSTLGRTDGAAATAGSPGRAEITGRYSPGRGSSQSTNTAALTVGSGGPLAALLVRTVREVAMADELSAAVLEVVRLDGEGRVAVTDRTPVVMVSQTAGVSVGPVSDAGGVIAFAIRSATPGRVALTAGVPGQPGFNSPATEVAFMQSAGAARPALRAATQSVAAGESTTVYVGLESPSGGAAANPGPPLRFGLQSVGGVLATTAVEIPTGATRTEEVRLTALPSSRSISVTAMSVGGKALSPVQVSVAPAPAVTPPSAPAGSNLAALIPSGGRNPVAGEETRLVIRARTGETTLTGAQAFGLTVKLNGRVLTQFPENLQISLGKRDIRGLSMRTSQGEAELYVKYTGTGTLEFEPAAAPASAQAYDHWGVAGQGDASTGSSAVAARITYVPGPLTRLVATMDPALASGAVSRIRAARGRYTLVSLTPADGFGNPTGTACEATLTRLSGTVLSLRAGNMEAAQQAVPVAQNGSAAFVIAAGSGQAGSTTWAPSAVCGSTVVTSAALRIDATLESAPTPTIESAGGDAFGANRLVSTDADLILRLARDPQAPALAEVLLYDGTTLVGRYGPVQLQAVDAGFRTVRVPRQDFGAGSRLIVLRVRINSGAEVSDDSAPVYVDYSP